MSKTLHIDPALYDSVIIGNPCLEPILTNVALAVNTTDKVMLPSRLTAAQIAAIAAPIAGMFTYDTTNHDHKYYNGTSWVSYIGPTGPIGLTGPTGPAWPSTDVQSASEAARDAAAASALLAKRRANLILSGY